MRQRGVGLPTAGHLVNGLCYASLMRSSPPLSTRGEDAVDLRDMIIRAQADRRSWWEAGESTSTNFPAAARGIAQPPLIAAVHPPRQRATCRAGGRAGTGRGQNMRDPHQPELVLVSLATGHR